VLVTGGGSGIGRCTAHELASLGADLALVGRKMEKLETVKAEIEQTCKVKISLHSCDIREEERVKETVADVVGGPRQNQSPDQQCRGAIPLTAEHD